MTFKRYLSLLVILNLVIVVNVVRADEDQGAGFGGPNATENILDEDTKKKGGFITERITQPWFDWKKKIQQKYGLALGFDYSAVYLKSSKTGLSGDDNAAGGMVRFFGAWDLIGRGTKDSGAIVWKVKHRHKYTDNSAVNFLQFN